MGKVKAILFIFVFGALFLGWNLPAVSYPYEPYEPLQYTFLQKEGLPIEIYERQLSKNENLRLSTRHYLYNASGKRIGSSRFWSNKAASAFFVSLPDEEHVWVLSLHFIEPYRSPDEPNSIFFNLSSTGDEFMYYDNKERAYLPYTGELTSLFTFPMTIKEEIAIDIQHYVEETTVKTAVKAFEQFTCPDYTDCLLDDELAGQAARAALELENEELTQRCDIDGVSFEKFQYVSDWGLSPSNTSKVQYVYAVENLEKADRMPDLIYLVDTAGKKIYKDQIKVIKKQFEKGYFTLKASKEAFTGEVYTDVTAVFVYVK